MLSSIVSPESHLTAGIEARRWKRRKTLILAKRNLHLNFQKGEIENRLEIKS
jgi:hypothetical protein